MSVITPQNITQNFLTEVTAYAPKAGFMPFEKIASALKYLEEKGIPNAKHEDYKYCNVEAIIRKEFKTLSSSFSSVNKETISSFRKDKNANYVFVVNGEIVEEISDLNSLEKGVTVVDINKAEEKFKAHLYKHFTAYAKEDSDAFIALNTAFAGKGLFVHVSKNTVAKKPLHIIYIDSASENVLLNYRKLFLIEEGAQFFFSETFETSDLKGKLFSNHVSEIHCAENSILKHTLSENAGDHSYGINTIQVSQESKSNYTINTFVFGGALVRNNLNIVVNGEHAETHLNGLCVTHDTQLVDNHTLVNHAKPNCESNELYKGVASGKSVLVFNGKIFVKKDSQKINAYQSSKNILMSDDATVNTKPQLEIFANDVKCSHGTSTGKIDEESMFYLKSRGIGEVNAKKLLLHAFAGEVVDKVTDENLRAQIEERLNEVLK